MIRLIELFSGIGAQAKALKNLGLEFEHYKTCDWEVNATKSYHAIHSNDNKDYSEFFTKEELVDKLFKLGISSDGKKPMTFDSIKRKGELWLRQTYNAIKATNNLVDITKVHAKDLGIVDTDKYDYLLTYSFPCTDLSLAGKMAGMEKGSGTSSSMLWEVERILKECDNLPQYLLMENVPQVHSSKNAKAFEKWLDILDDLGYVSRWFDLNSKHYGVPQNRNRTFVVSIRKDIDDGSFDFPKPFKLELKLKDLLDQEVDEKYYLSKKQLAYVLDAKDVALKSGRNINNRIVNPEIAKTISCRGAADQRADVTNFVINGCDEEVTVQNLKDKIKEFGEEKIICEQRYDEGLRFFKDNICGSLRTIDSCGDKRVIEIPKDDSLWIDVQAQMITEDGDVKRYINSDVVDKFEEGQCADISFPNGYNKSNRVHDECPAINLTTTKNSFVYKENQIPLRIRKLTPKECWRLMGFDDEDFDKASKVNSDSSLYKQAGNSIVVNVLMLIFKQLFGGKC